MHLIPSKPLDTYGSDWMISDDGEVWLCKYEVMFGYRLRGGYMSELYSHCEIDFCCGDKMEVYQEIKDKVMKIIEHNGTEDPFKDLPLFSKVKPYPNDQEFVDRINQLYRSTQQNS